MPECDAQKNWHNGLQDKKDKKTGSELGNLYKNNKIEREKNTGRIRSCGNKKTKNSNGWIKLRRKRKFIKDSMVTNKLRETF